MMNDGYSNLPLGFGMRLVTDEFAKQKYESLSEAEKEEIIFRCKDAKSEDEMDKIMNSFSATGEIGELLRGQDI